MRTVYIPTPFNVMVIVEIRIKIKMKQIFYAQCAALGGKVESRFDLD